MICITISSCVVASFGLRMGSQMVVVVPRIMICKEGGKEEEGCDTQLFFLLEVAKHRRLPARDIAS